MAQRRETEPKGTSKRRPAATTPEARENQLIAMAYDHAEKQIQEGTVSAQVLSHFLKLGSTREKLEQQRLEMEVEFMGIKAEAAKSEARVEELYAEAIAAMRRYSGQQSIAPEDDVFDD